MSERAIRVAVDIVIFTLREGVLHVLLIRRRAPPFKGTSLQIFREEFEKVARTRYDLSVLNLVLFAGLHAIFPSHRDSAFAKVTGAAGLLRRIFDARAFWL